MVLPSHQENQSLGSCSLSQKDLMNPTASTPTIPTFRHGRLLATIAFVLVAALLCSVTVRHLAADNTASPLEAQEGHPVQQSPSPSIGVQLDAIRTQLAGLTEALQDFEQKASQAVDQQVLPKDMPQLRQRLLARRQMAWQPMKRMVSWQPVKRQMQMADPYYADETALQGGESAKEKVMFMVEQQLQQVLAAGERLGVSANEILLHLRTRNG